MSKCNVVGGDVKWFQIWSQWFNVELAKRNDNGSVLYWFVFEFVYVFVRNMQQQHIDTFNGWTCWAALNQTEQIVCLSFVHEIFCRMELYPAKTQNKQISLDVWAKAGVSIQAIV